MRKPSFFRFKVLLLMLPILALLVVGGQSTPSKAEAFGPFAMLGFAWAASNVPIPGTGGDRPDTFSCWVTGPLAGQEDDSWTAEYVDSWGDKRDEFVVDRDDLGDDARFASEVNPKYLKDSHPSSGEHEPRVYTLFDSLPELVEYGFALDVIDDSFFGSDRGTFDRRVKLLALKLLSERDPPAVIYPDAAEDSGEDSRMLLPWDDLDQYLDRRAVAVPYDDAVVSQEIGWHDPTAPGGGATDDSVAMAQDEVSNWIENTESTTTHAGGGGVIHYGTTEGVGQQVLFQADENCGNVGVCNGLVNFSSNPVPITLHTNIREQNDGQFIENVVGPGERVMLVVEGVDTATGNAITREIPVEFDQRRVPPSGTSLLGAGASYARQHQPDTGSDILRVTVELRSEYRRDLEAYEPGPGYDPRPLPAMGFDPWTYDLVNKGRDYSVNEWVRGGFNHVSLDTVEHQGYRQPTLSRPYDPDPNVNSNALTRTSAEHIRWPVNFEDLNWYLYKLPSTGYRDPLWLYWLTPRGTSWLVNSAYGQTPVQFPSDGQIPDPNPPAGETIAIPNCVLPVDEAQFADAGRRAPLNISAVECTYPVASDWDDDAARTGFHDAVHFPFDFTGADQADDHRALNSGMLVKQGVESAEDAKNPLGSRRLNRFSFSIVEGQAMGETPPDQRGGEAPKRHGIPRDPGGRKTYLDGWANEPVSPNMPHLLVVTFYEGRMEEELKFGYLGRNEYSEHLSTPDYGDDAETINAFGLPKREIRRVVCRMMVYPSGFEPAMGEMKSVMDLVDDRFGVFISAKFEQVKAIVEGFLASISTFPIHAGAKTAELACIGMAKVDDLTSLENVAGPRPPALVDRDGRIRVNAAQASKNAGSDRCHRISSPPTTTCERSADFIFQGRCTRLPEFKLKVRAAEFVKPPSDGIEFKEFRVFPDHEAYYTDTGEQDFMKIEAAVHPLFLPDGIPKFSEVADLDADPRPDLTVYNRGLTRVAMDWDFRSKDSVDPDIYDRISGFTVYVHPDQKSVPFEVPKNGIGFDLPRWVLGSLPEEGIDRTREFQVRGFTVGGLEHYEILSDIALPYSNSLISLDLPYDGATYTPVGNSDLKASFKGFNQLVGGLPLAPGFTHGFRVASYFGVPGDPGFRRGPPSDTVWLSGDKIACNEIRGGDHDPDDVDLVRDLYNCGAGADVASLGYAPDEWRPGLLSLTGTDICDDIFSSTPAGLTWDNPVVRQVWLLMTVVGGSVLFTLLVWQGLRMTYDVWLDPQPATGFRELLPRFLMSAALMASSLVICQLVLTVASDLTCFIAQFTGMSMWGAIGVTFGAIVDGYMVWYEDLLSISNHTLTFLLSNFLLLLAFGLVVVLVMVYILYLFARVFLGMLIRIAMLAVLIAFAPIAFAFYASDATSHWTKKWVSMFLGTTFQQVVVLIVIYIGVSMLGNFLTQGVEGDLTSLVVGMIIAFLTLSLAVSVPDLVNPGANKMFSGFTQMGTMAGAAAMMVASGGLSAVAGGVQGGFGGGGGGGGGGGDSPSAPSSPSGPSSPSKPASSGDGITSSVNRQHLGPSTVPSAPSSGAQDQGPAGLSSSDSPSVSGGPSGPDSSGGGVTLSTAPPSDVQPEGVQPGPAPRSQQKPPGFLRRVGSGMVSGWSSGARWGAGVNTRAANLANGRAFYQSGAPIKTAAQRAATRLEENMIYEELAKAMKEQQDS